MNNDEIAALLHRMAEEASRLPRNDRRDPERFHEERAEFGSRLSMLAGRLNPRPLIASRRAGTPENRGAFARG
jgi:hypothetical protein